MSENACPIAVYRSCSICHKGTNLTGFVSRESTNVITELFHPGRHAWEDQQFALSKFCDLSRRRQPLTELLIRVLSINSEAIRWRCDPRKESDLTGRVSI